jgi:hypothetical protein
MQYYVIEFVSDLRLKVSVEKKEHAIKALKEEKDNCLNR